MADGELVSDEFELWSRLANKFQRAENPNELDFSSEDILGCSLSIAKPGWEKFAESLSVDEVIRLIRLATLAEMRYASMQCGAKSPVIKLVKILKSKSAFSDELQQWIKSVTTNRYLPYGDLMDML
jgi:hypothetical protein